MRTTRIPLDEVARALKVSPEDLIASMEHFKHFGFPEPVTDDGSHWAVADLLDWSLSQQDLLLSLVSHLSDVLVERDA
jgi:hypothetical protein